MQSRNMLILIAISVGLAAGLQGTSIYIKNETTQPASVHLTFDKQMNPHWCSDSDITIASGQEQKVDYTFNVCPLQQVQAVVGNFGPYDTEKTKSTVSWGVQGQGLSHDPHFVIRSAAAGKLSLDLVS